MLDDRKLQVLYAIINSYLFSAEPIGSRTISKNFSLGVSSATIRNEMSDLEELGYLSKTHTSSGRIPSDKAYRHYVNDLLSQHLHLVQEKNKRLLDIFQRELQDTDRMIESATRILSALTKYTAVGLIPQKVHKKVKRIDFLPVEEKLVLCVIVFENNEADNFFIRLQESLSKEELETLSFKFSKILYGLPINKVDKTVRKVILNEMQEYRNVLKEFVPLFEDYAKENAEWEVQLQGISNMFDYPEYSDLDKAKNFLTFLEDKDNIRQIIDETEEDLVIRIGKENTSLALADSSVIYSTLHDGDDIIGHIGIIGPVRMDYKSVISALWSLNRQLESLLDE